MLNTITDEYNAVIGLIIAILSMIFGEYWYLFAAFLVFNVMDWISGWINGRKYKKESSKKGLEGVLKKVGYWLLICLSFLMSAVFIEIGKLIHVDLQITSMFGWFVLASLIVNEVRSIVENLVEFGIEVPYIIIKGLEIADKVIDEVTMEDERENETDSHKEE